MERFIFGSMDAKKKNFNPKSIFEKSIQVKGEENNEKKPCNSFIIIKTDTL